MGSGHTVFANRESSGHVTNRGINVQTDTNQDQGCKPSGTTSGISNACTATSGSGGSTQTSVILNFANCSAAPFSCNTPVAPYSCNNIGCQSISCTATYNELITGSSADCTTDNGVQLISCTLSPTAVGLFCTRVEAGTGGISSSGGVIGDDGG
jgi:hypothetical protein